MLYDVETRSLIARERAALLRAEAERYARGQVARRWLSEQLIAAGVRLAPDCSPRRRPLRAV
jgi:hypothetical protein